MQNRKNVLIGGLIVAVILMAVGYAALSEQLEIGGTAEIDAEWNVEIFSITETLTTDATTESTNSTATTATFEVKLHEPGAIATYDVRVENNGTIDAIVDSINLQQSEDVADVEFSFSGIEVGNVLAADHEAEDAHIVSVTVEWDSEATEVPEPPAETTETLTLTIVYVQN